ncbi:hypothetical protein INT48_002063 [Thamnidium elegans]|uniref:Transcription activator GCR1-like domain-containing protein n=1 Tax=Thamnidium elegans TaxID=101142 RepID=A0A8H7SHV9_9FUNG|nr:hypothetical protein INT48_002063 [Thamnidium elegans]
MQNHPHNYSSKQTDEPLIDEGCQMDLDNDNNTASNTQMNVAESQRLPSTNTVKAYGAKQKEWKAWCTEIKQFEDGVIVTDEKLCLFLKDYVIPRGNINVKKVDNTKRALGSESILAFVKAIQNLRKEQSALGINTYPTYRSELLKTFLDSHNIKSTPKKTNSNEEFPMNQQLQVLMPELVNIINSGFNSILTSLNAMQTQIENHCREMEEYQSSTRNLISESLMQMATNITNPHQYNRGTSEEATVILEVPRSLNNSEVSSSSSPVSPAQYKMKRNLVTINDLWQEYDVGLSGNPSIKSLEEEFGTKWRKSRTESKFFSTRLIVYKEVQKISRDDCISTEEAAKKLERRRVDLKVSIDKLIKLIKASAL